MQDDEWGGKDSGSDNGSVADEAEGDLGGTVPIAIDDDNGDGEDPDDAEEEGNDALIPSPDVVANADFLLLLLILLLLKLL